MRYIPLHDGTRPLPDESNPNARGGFEAGMVYRTAYSSDFHIMQGPLLEINDRANWELAQRYSWADDLQLGTETLLKEMSEASDETIQELINQGILRPPVPGATEDETLRQRCDDYRLWLYKRFVQLMPGTRIWQYNQRTIYTTDVEQFSHGVVVAVFAREGEDETQFLKEVQNEIARIDPNEGAPICLNTSPRVFGGGLMFPEDCRKRLELAIEHTQISSVFYFDADGTQRPTTTDLQDIYQYGIKPITSAMKFPQGMIPWPGEDDEIIEPEDMPGVWDFFDFSDSQRIEMDDEGNIKSLIGMNGNMAYAVNTSAAPWFDAEKRAMYTQGKSGLYIPEARFDMNPVWYILCSWRTPDTGHIDGTLIDGMDDSPRHQIEQRKTGHIGFYNGGSMTDSKLDWTAGRWEVTAVRISEYANKEVWRANADGIFRVLPADGAGREIQKTGTTWGNRNNGSNPYPGWFSELTTLVPDPYWPAERQLRGYIRGVLARQVQPLGACA